MRPLLISLFDYSGEWARPRAATHDVVLVDIQHGAGSFRYMSGHEVLCVGMDVREFVAAWSAGVLDCIDTARPVDVVLAAPPCRVFCKPGARLWGQWDASGETADGLSMVDAVLHFVAMVEPRVWAMENPPGRLANLKGTGLRQDRLGKPALSFNPCDYAAISEDTVRTEAYTKRTYIWGRFLAPVAHPMPPEPYPAHLPPGRRDRTSALGSGDYNKRTQTPKGFARSFRNANAHQLS